MDYILHTIKDSSTRLLPHIGYWRRLGSSEDFAGQILADCVEVIHSDIVGVWNFPDKDKVYLFFRRDFLACLGRSVLVRHSIQRWDFSSYSGFK